MYLLLFCVSSLGVAASSPQQQTDPEEQTEEKKTDSPSTVQEESGTKRARLGAGGFSTKPGGPHLQPGKMNARPRLDPSKPAPQQKRWEFAGAPIPVISPTVGNGLAGAAAVLVHLNPKDTVSPPSVFGGGVLFTENGTRGWAVGTELFLKEDRFRILAAVGDATVNFDYYGKGHAAGQNDSFLPLSMKPFLYLVEPKVRVFRRWYIGPRYHILKSSVAVDRDKLKDDEFPSLPDLGIPDEDLELKSAALGLRVERDTRDSQFYARKGSLFDTKPDFYDKSFGSNRDYQYVEIAFQGYVGFKKKNVIAYRGAVCSASKRSPFYSLCLFGQTQDIRGYAVGRYQDHRMLVGQIEYRRELFWRLGAVAYFGAGEVAPSFSDFSTKNILPGGGIGAPFTLAEESHINFRVDFAWGEDSSALYVGIAEVF